MRAHAGKGCCRHRDIGNRSDVCASEARRTDTGDRDGNPVQQEGLADRCRTAQELPFPVPVADDGHERGAALIVRSREQPARGRIQTKCLVIRAGDESARHSPDRIGRARIENETAEAGHTRKDLLLIGQRTDDGIREALRGAPTGRPSPIGDLHLQLNQFLRIAHGQPPQHQRVDQAEDRGVGSDAQSQRQDNDEDESRIPGEHAEGVT